MGYRSDQKPPSSSSIAHRLSPLACACVALALLFAAVFQMDHPAIEWSRSLEAAWIVQVGDAGHQLGRGASLIIISGLFVLIGYLRKRPEWYQAGLRGWLAHAVTAVLVQGLKHGIGRPRPRLHRDEEFFTGPSLDAGLDSFPSGHAAASFAVASVLAHFCPALARPAYALAGFVALTRVVRGSHFVSDVVVGVVLGFVVGTLAATPVQEWKTALSRALPAAAQWLVAACVVVWLIVLPAPGTLTTGLLIGTGAAVLLARLTQGWAEEFGPPSLHPSPLEREGRGRDARPEG